MTARAIKKQKQNANKDKPETHKKWGGGGDFRGDHLIFRRTKGGIAENIWKDSEGGPLKFAWKMKAWG